MKKHTLGITQRISVIQPHGEKRDSLSMDWYPFLTALDIPWLVLPNIPNIALRMATNFDIDALILTGGDDLGVFPERDETEFALLAWARHHSRQVLGVCRGFQVIFQYLGGTLVSVNSEIHRAKRHEIVLTEGNSREVNSYHNLAPTPLQSLMKPLAFSACDNSLEAATAETFLGIMWHPERENIPLIADLDLIKRHFKES